MKRIITWLLTFAMVFGFAIVPSAAATSMTVSGETVSDVSIAEGSQTVTCKVSVKDNPGFVTAKIAVGWPKEDLELVKWENGTLLADKELTPAIEGNTGSFVITLGDTLAKENVTDDGVLLTLTFKTTDGATAGAKPITLALGGDDEYDFMNTDFDPVAVTFEAGSITLTEGETPAPVEDKVDTPVITPNGKTMEKDGDSVDITIGGVMTSGAAIFYTLGDQAEAEYTSSSAISLYTSGGAIFTTPGGINLGSSVVLKAWAKVGDLMSEVAEATFSIKSESSGGGGGGGGGSATPAKQFPYTDVAENDYFRKPVEWALKKGVLSAEYPSKFNPTMGATRSDMVYYLWLAKGSPAPTTTEMPFTDVAASADYYNAVLWAYENGITAGVSATEFAPNQTVTRAQAITFLYGVAGRPAAGSEPFDDVNAEDYFAAPVAWAYGKGITAGTSANLFSPDRGCQRAQIITFMALYFAD